MDGIKKIFYVYYSFEESGRGYIGYRKCPEGKTPESDTYLGSYYDKTFKPTGKTILKRNLTQREAISVEIYFQRKYEVAEEWNKEFANLSYQTSVGFCYSASGKNNPKHGKKCYNNGINNRYFSPNEEIPEGYILGDKGETRRKHSEARKGENHPNHGKNLYNNGIENRYFSPEEEIPEGFVLGVKEETRQKKSGENHPCHGKKWYNNGVKNRRFSPDEEIPKGYILGIKEEIGGNHSKAMKGENNPNYGKNLYNNGIENKFFSPDEEIPEGFILGMKEETRRKQLKVHKGENHSNHGKNLYNNGIEQRYCSPDEEIPEGYIIGVKEETIRKQSEAMKSINSKKKNRVITPSCCYFSVKDAYEGLGISQKKFYKLFEKDPLTGFYMEKEFLYQDSVREKLISLHLLEKSNFF